VGSILKLHPTRLVVSICPVFGPRFFKNWLPLVLWMLVIFCASTKMGSPQYTSRFIGPLVHWLVPDISKESMARVHYCVRKTSHFVEYAILGILLLRALRGENFVTSASREIILVILLCALYAASDELHQEFVRGREASVADVALDASGAGTGVLLWCCLTWRRKST
jgi:VanZ family protein